MVTTGGYQQYQQNAVLTASPKELILMLYNGAIKFCNLSIEAFEQGNVQKQHQYLIKTQDIITELQLSLNPSIQISSQFDELYKYIKRLLLEANVKKDIEKVLEAKKLIVEFRDIWQEAMKLA